MDHGRVRAVLHGGRPDHVLERVRPSRHVQTVLRFDLANQRIEMGPLDEGVLRLEEGVARLGGECFPERAELRAGHQAGKPLAPWKGRIGNEACRRPPAGLLVIW